MRNNKIITIIGFLLGLSFVSSVFAATISISPNLPGSLTTTPSGSSPGAYIQNFYQYALFISGFLAFAAIVYGGLKYTIARGNPSGESEAKQWIWSALLGMLLLAGAYIILFTINPNLVNLSLPSVQNVPVDLTTLGTPTITPTQQQQINQIGQQPCHGLCPGKCQADNTCSVIIINPNAGNIAPK